MYGYLQTDQDRNRQQLRNLAFGTTAIAGVGAYVFSGSLSKYTSNSLDKFASKAEVRQTIDKSVTKVAQGLSSLSVKIANSNTRISKFFQSPGNEITQRADYYEVDNLLTKADRLVHNRDLVNLVIGNLKNYNWNDDKIASFVESTGFVKSVLGAEGNSASSIQEIIKKSIDTSGSKFRSYLQNEGVGFDRAIQSASIDLYNARQRARADSYSIGSTISSGISDDIRSVYADYLRDKSNPTTLERLLGFERQNISKKEANQIGGLIDPTSGVDVYGLKTDLNLGRFIDRSGNQYDFSGYFRLFERVKNVLSERIIVPMSPGSMGISLGQFAPFLVRSGNKPLSGVIQDDFSNNEVRLFLGSRVINYDAATGKSSIDSNSYNIISAKNKHLQSWLDADTELRDRRRAIKELEKTDPSRAAKEKLRLFSPIEGLGRKPGTIPYWDTPAAFFRKFKSKDYLPNLLKLGTRSNIASNEDARRLVNAISDIGEAGLEDSAFIALYDKIKDYKVGNNPLIREVSSSEIVYGHTPVHINPSIHNIVDRLRNGDGDTYDKFAEIIEDIHNFYNNQHGGTEAARIRSWTTQLMNMNLRERKEWLRRTADYSASRKTTRLFGLDNVIGQQRYTQLDILRSELFLNTLKFGSFADLDSIANDLSKGGHHHGALLVHSRALEATLNETTQDVELGFRRVNSYLSSHGKLRERLNLESLRRRNLFDLQPLHPDVAIDFDKRTRYILMKKEGQLNPLRIIKSLIGEGTTRGEATSLSTFAYFWPHRISEALEDQLGLHISPLYKASAGRLLGATSLAFGALVALPEIHKFANRITRDIPILNLLNPDLHRANVLSLIGRISHRGYWRRRLDQLLPGMEWYVDPKTEEEQRRHERGAGYTVVRKGRWWLFGSKEPIFGQKVNYFLPSAERLALSDWQGARNSDRNTWRYWLHRGGVLNPINWGNGAYWWEEAHKKDRPYVVSGSGLFKPRRIYHPEFLPRRLGGTLEDQIDRATDPLRSAKAGILPTKYVATRSRFSDPSRDPILNRINAARRLRGKKPLSKSNPISPEERNYLKQIGYDNGLVEGLYRLQEFGGLYGYLASFVNKGVGHPVGKTYIETPDRAYGRENNFYQQELGGLGGNLSDTLRRFIPHRRRSIQDYNPVPNTMPSWMSEEFKTGDPYARIPFGEVRLPGQAYERTHPGTTRRLLQMRASSIGKAKEDIEAYLRNKVGDGRSSQAADVGTEMHRILQRRWRSLGILEADEVRVYNEELNVTGHIDAILRMPSNNGSMKRVIVDIKTKTRDRFEAVKRSGKPEDENLDQIQFYMYTTGIKEGLLTYVNRDDPGHETYQVRVKYDPSRMRQIKKRLADARSTVLNELKSGQLSSGDLYDTVTRYEILADVSPNSQEFSNLKSIVRKNMDSYSEEEQARIREADYRVSKVRQGFELHAYRFRNLDDRTYRTKVKVAVINTDGTIVDTKGRSFHLAGLNISTNIPYNNRGELLRKEGRVKEGSEVTVITSSPVNDKNSRSTSAAIIVGNTNVGKKLLRIGMADEDQEDFSAPSVINRFSNREIMTGSLWELFAHMDTPLHTKFLPVRSGLEEYERTDVYGKKSGSWDSPVSSFLTPTIVSLTNKNPISATLFGAGLAALFFPFTKERGKAAAIGAIVGLGLSLFGLVNKATGTPFIPKAVKRRRELDTYYDTLTYIKYRRLAAQEEMEAKKHGENVDEIESGRINLSESDRVRLENIKEKINRLKEERDSLTKRKNISDKSLKNQKSGVQYLEQKIRSLERTENNIETGNRRDISPHTQLALMYRRKYRATLRGSLDGHSSWDAVIAALPKTSRDAIIDVVQHGSVKEKRRLYSLLPDNQKAVLGYRLGIDPRKIPGLESLEDYFQKHKLPGTDYAGWNADISLDMLKAKEVTETHQDPMDFGIYPAQVEAATQGSPEAYLKTPSRATGKISHAAVRQRIRDLLTGKGMSNIEVTIDEVPANDNQDSHEAEIEMNIKHDRTRAIFSKFKSNRGF